MISLIDFKELFRKIGFTKMEEDNLWDNEISKLKYKDGGFYWEK